MTEQSEKWDNQWRALLTHCYGEVNADKTFKADLLGKLKGRMAEVQAEAAQTVTDESATDEHNWRRLLKTAYIPCHPDSEFKTTLLAQLKAKQAETASPATDSESLPEDAIRTILNKSYEPVEPRREFETRLLHNLKERQRTTVVARRSTRRRTIFMSAASSIAAAAMVMFAVWVMPQTNSSPTPLQNTIQANQSTFSLPLPELAIRAVDEPNPNVARVSFGGSADAADRSVIPASFEPENRYATDYNVVSAFAGPALAASAMALRNVEMKTNGDWETTDEAQTIALKPGTSFRASSGMGHLKFPDGSLLSLSPDSLLEVTRDGIAVNQGFVLVAVPESSQNRFRLHFPERDIAVEPGTDLAVMVEDPSLFADGGAPAPMVMVVDRPGSTGGLALARGKNGVGPLFASQLYRLDNYVTPDLPGRTMCDTECQDLNNLFKTETIRETLPMAAFAGGFSNDRDLSYTTTVLSPAGFTKKGDCWIADSYRNESTIKVQYLSDEYFGFANERRDLARALALGSRVIIDGGNGAFYEIYK